MRTIRQVPVALGQVLVLVEVGRLEDRHVGSADELQGTPAGAGVHHEGERGPPQKRMSEATVVAQESHRISGQLRYRVEIGSQREGCHPYDTTAFELRRQYTMGEAHACHQATRKGVSNRIQELAPST